MLRLFRHAQRKPARGAAPAVRPKPEGGDQVRSMYDGISPAGIPGGADLYAGYDDGNWPDADALAAQYPGKRVLRITVNPSDNEGDVLDVETGDANPVDAPPWAERRRAVGVDPWVYCSEQLYGAVQAAFIATGVRPPIYWVARWDGVAALDIPGASAKQYQSTPDYDESVVADYIEGWDPAPAPAPAPAPVTGDTVHTVEVALQVDGNRNGWIPSPVQVDQVVAAVVIQPTPDGGQYYDTPIWTGEAQTSGPNSPNGALIFKGGAPGGYAVRLTVQG